MIGGVVGASCRVVPVLITRDPVSYWVWPTIGYGPLDAEVSGPQYLFQGTIHDSHGRLHFDRGGIFPALHGPAHVSIVLRIEGVLPDADFVAGIARQVAHRWEEMGTQVDGVQLDFDAPAAGLDQYGQLLGQVRQALPRQYRFSITGLGSWLFDAPASVREAISSHVDYVAFQFYQGSHPLRDPARYLNRLLSLNINFKIGLLPFQANAAWLPSFIMTPKFKGYMYFLSPATTGEHLTQTISTSTVSLLVQAGGLQNWEI